MAMAGATVVDTAAGACKHPLMKRLLIGVCSALIAFVSISAQAPNTSARLTTAKSPIPRTADGKPDLTGNWTNATLTPFERTANRPLIVSEESARLIEISTHKALDERDGADDPSSVAPPAIAAPNQGENPELAQFERRWQAGFGSVGGYNSLWVDPGERVLRIDGKPRSSMLIDPPDGRVPPLTPEARARAAALAEQRTKAGAEFDHPELRPLAERCIMSFGNNAGPPMLPNYWYNNNYTFVQAGTQVMMLTEMVHDVRVVRIGGEHAPKSIRQWMGDSIGRWEGDTLIVETTNFHRQHGFRGAWENLKVTERFTMADANTIHYKFTIDDSTTWTAPFTGELAFRRMPEGEMVYEYACHEGNYALEGVLSGARALERDAVRKKSQQ
jgi:hypothetical protein